MGTDRRAIDAKSGLQARAAFCYICQASEMPVLIALASDLYPERVMSMSCPCVELTVKWRSC